LSANDDEFAVPLDQALMNSGRQRMPTLGGASLGAGQRGDLVDLVGAQADQGRFARPGRSR
jgi:hypothetical protein